MQLLKGLLSQRRIRTDEALFASSGFKELLIRSDQKLFTQYAASSAKLIRIAMAVRLVLLRHFGMRVEVPHIPAINSSATGDFDRLWTMMVLNLQTFCREFTEGLRKCGLGKIEWSSPTSCSFDYPEVRVVSGIFTRTVSTFRHRHDLVGARQHLLPAEDVARSRIVDTIMRELPADLHRFLRIVTGLEVVKNITPESQRNENTAFGEAIFGTGQAVVDGAKVAADAAVEGAKVVGAVAAGAAVLTGVAALMPLIAAVAVPVAIADPALCLGDVVLCGWENE